MRRRNSGHDSNASVVVGDMRVIEARHLELVGSWTWDMERDVAEASPELNRILGIDPGVLGDVRDVERYVHADDRLFVRAHLDALRELESTNTTFDFRILRADGAVRFVVAHTFVKYDAHGRPCVAWGTLQDVTERRALEAQIERGQRMESLGQLATGIAHDLNNLLTVIGVEAQCLSDGLERDDPLNAEAETIRNAASGAAALTRQLLTFAGGQSIRERQVDLNERVTETVRMLKRLIGEHVELVTTLDPHIPPIRCDPGQIERVLVNLAVNARDAMPEGGVLTIATERMIDDDGGAPLPYGEYIVLTVADTGYGMDEFVRQRAFDPFFTTKPPEHGTGLGLATVLGIVERTGGRIAVLSEPGRGTRFTLHLPRADTDDLAPEPHSLTVRPRGGLPAGTTVLLVEDENLLRRALEHILQREGCRVLVADDGYDALAVARAFDGRIDLVITDVVMPKLNARGMVVRLREGRPDVRVLHMSAYPREELLRRGLLDHATNLLEKPFTGAEMMDAAREALRATG